MINTSSLISVKKKKKEKKKTEMRLKNNRKSNHPLGTDLMARDSIVKKKDERKKLMEE